MAEDTVTQFAKRKSYKLLRVS